MISSLFNPIYQGFAPNYVILFQTQQEYPNSSQLGDKYKVAENVNKEIEAFPCIMYSYSKENSVNVARSKILKKMVGEDNDLTKESKVDLLHLPPCQDSLLPYIYIVNRQLAFYKRTNVPTFKKPKPNDENQGWLINKNEILEPLWTNAE